MLKPKKLREIPEKGAAMELKEVLAAIRPASREAYEACVTRFNGIGKPVGSLGRLETLLERIAAASDSADIDIGKKCVLVFCADNGVLAQGVAQSTHEITTVIARSLLRGTASVSAMARAVGADVFPVDMGMIDPVEGMENHAVARGTGDISRENAMTRRQAAEAILTGVELVRQRKAEGYRLIATGEAGIGNTTTAAAVTAALLGLEPETVTGRGSGLSDAGLDRKRRAIRRALEGIIFLPPLQVLQPIYQFRSNPSPDLRPGIGTDRFCHWDNTSLLSWDQPHQWPSTWETNRR